MPARSAQSSVPPPPPPSPKPTADAAALSSDATDPAELALVRAIQRDGSSNAAAWTTLLKRYQDRLYAVCLRMSGNPETAADLTQDSMVKIIQGLPGYDARSKLSTWMIRVAMNTCFSYLRGQKLRKHASLDAIIDAGAPDDPTWNRPSRDETSTKNKDRSTPHPARSLPKSNQRGHDSSAAKAASEEDAPADPTSPHSPGERPEGNASPRLFSGPGGANSAGSGRGKGGGGGWREQYREQTPEESVEHHERKLVVAKALASLAVDQRAILVLRDVQGFDYDQIADSLGLAVGTVKSRLFRARLALREEIERLEGDGNRE